MKYLINSFIVALTLVSTLDARCATPACNKQNRQPELIAPKHQTAVCLTKHSANKPNGNSHKQALKPAQQLKQQHKNQPIQKPQQQRTPVAQPSPKPTRPSQTQRTNVPKTTNSWLASKDKSLKNYQGYEFTQSFDAGMIGHASDEQIYNTFLNKTSAKKALALLKERYEYFVKNLEDRDQEELRIPKIIHQIWVGPHPFPQDARNWQQSWLDKHPNWEYKLWTNQDVEELDFENKKYYDDATNWGEKADILRYEILHRFGGVYVDIDEQCLQPLDLLHDTCDFYAGVHALPLMTVHQNALRINNAVIGAQAGHPILEAAVANIKKSRKHKELLHRTGPDFFTKMILQAWDTSTELGNMDVVFPANYFYPNAKRSGQQFTITAKSTIYVKPETLAIHYYTGYWVKPPKK